MMRTQEEEDALTLAIMGPPRRFRLGVPVRPSDTGTPNPAVVKVGLLPRIQSWWAARSRAQRRAAGALAGVALPAGLVLAYLAGSGDGQDASSPSQAAGPQAAPAVAAPAAPAIIPQLPLAPPPAARQEGAPILPPTASIGISTATFAAPAAAPAVAAAPAKPAPLPPVAAVPAKPMPLPPAPVAPARVTMETEKPPAAVILDASGKPSPGLPAGVPPTAPPAKPVVQSSPQPVAVGPAAAPMGGGKLATPAREVPAVAGAEGKAPALEGAGPRVIVVDIDKSGTFALITNPQTRLPEKVTTGQKIFTGETVKKIDPAAGKIQLDSRTITMQ